uniref:Uncharacterized protein n=1 Tax=Arundo donax TaxID=35708 RepID=A0A0A9HQR9_ARUDO
MRPSPHNIKDQLLSCLFCTSFLNYMQVYKAWIQNQQVVVMQVYKAWIQNQQVVVMNP